MSVVDEASLLPPSADEKKSQSDVCCITILADKKKIRHKKMQSDIPFPHLSIPLNLALLVIIIWGKYSQTECQDSVSDMHLSNTTDTIPNFRDFCVYSLDGTQKACIVYRQPDAIINDEPGSGLAVGPIL
jgi:hypothetical protein